MAAATQNSDETLASTDDQTTTKQKATRSKTNKTTEAQNTQTGDEKASDQGDLLNSQGPENGASQDEGNKPNDLKNGDSDNEDSSTIDNGNSTESSNESVSPLKNLDSKISWNVDELGYVANKTKETDISKAEHQIVENLAGSSISILDSLVINVTNNGFSTVLEPLSRVAIEAGKTASITCHNQTFKHQVLENLRQLKGLGKNLTVE
ncbi:hypothetical protein ACT4U9_06680 [Acinetobacter baumannii]|uniref:hypothetical protein n=1 Tax=Acinetobacter baumannii TaxID=470 RepID=UPI0002833C87|nr:hypothetical protein [Acinetobacter baumannii]WEU68029.1 hypothetical protein vBAbaMABMM1_09 [Acinetobacter phage vB_AbaM_ABMM1]EIB7139868.1 hypothetical protein [Acinetobacter baumannii]EKA66711.1 hypothetical protein ACINWC692_2381 [Acinetobacter baumannii WC-692]EKV4888602.1 hypothetical protein [Acinetobacter baumannii]KAA8947498.1 hypothetical protein DLI66_03050 [Acinetobacter baumannii]